jgi:hypothetical protein
MQKGMNGFTSNGGLLICHFDFIAGGDDLCGVSISVNT